jgi:hypothetical protein
MRLELLRHQVVVVHGHILSSAVVNGVTTRHQPM